MHRKHVDRTLFSTYFSGLSILVAYLTTLSVAETKERQISGLIHSKLEGVWKEAIVANFKALSRHFLRETKESHEKISFKIASFWEEIWNVLLLRQFS
jgi:hypothetical protein